MVRVDNDKIDGRLLLIATTALVVAMIAGITVLTLFNKSTNALIGVIGTLILPFVGLMVVSQNSKLDRVETKVDGVKLEVNGRLTRLLDMVDKFGTSPTYTVVPPTELPPTTPEESAEGK